MRITRRTHIINYLIKQNGYKSYLEIGVRTPSLNFDKINCEHKDGIDPNPLSLCKYTMTSDEFFKKISKNKMYDIIFIDGLHLCYQVLKDVNNSLEHLSIGGTIVLHDCNPISAIAQVENPLKAIKKWNGTVWKAFAILRMIRKDLTMYVVDKNQGCGVIARGSQKLFKKINKEKLTYAFLNKNRKSLLNLCSTKQFKNKNKG